jgi:L-carnitine CoA-transferase
MTGTNAGSGQPDFGVLSGVKVVYAGSALAGPFAAQLMAEFGADVCWIENALSPDMARGAGGIFAEMERRNQRTVSVDLQRAEGREVLLKLVTDAEILIESSRGSRFAEWGLADEALWGVNPKLIIVHVSGFGHYGDDRYTGRPSYDPIAQAYGCYLQLNGPPEGPAMPAHPYTGDYITGLFACSAALAALCRARRTGEGDSIDVAMFEALLRAGGPGPMEYLNLGRTPERKGAGHVQAGAGLYRCADGVDVYVLLQGAGVMRRGVRLLGIEDPDLFPPSMHNAAKGSPSGAALEQALGQFCASRPAAQVQEELSAVGVPCSEIYTYERARDDPHYQARRVFTTWSSVTGDRLEGVDVIPRFARRPGQVWRGAPTIGMDNEAILAEIGLTDQQVADLYASGVISKGPEPSRPARTK